MGPAKPVDLDWKGGSSAYGMVGSSSLAELLKRAEDAGRNLMPPGSTTVPGSSLSPPSTSSWCGNSMLSPGFSGGLGGSLGALGSTTGHQTSAMPSFSSFSTPERRTSALTTPGSGSAGLAGQAATAPVRDLLQGPVTYRRPGGFSDDLLRAAA